MSRTLQNIRHEIRALLPFGGKDPAYAALTGRTGVRKDENIENFNSVLPLFERKTYAQGLDEALAKYDAKIDRELEFFAARIKAIQEQAPTRREEMAAEYAEAQKAVKAETRDKIANLVDEAKTLIADRDEDTYFADKHSREWD